MSNILHILGENEVELTDGELAAVHGGEGHGHGGHDGGGNWHHGGSNWGGNWGYGPAWVASTVVCMGLLHLQFFLFRAQLQLSSRHSL